MPPIESSKDIFPRALHLHSLVVGPRVGIREEHHHIEHGIVRDRIVSEMSARSDVVVKVACLPRAEDFYCAIHGDQAAIGYLVCILCVRGRVISAEDVLADAGFDAIATDDYKSAHVSKFCWEYK